MKAMGETPRGIGVDLLGKGTGYYTFLLKFQDTPIHLKRYHEDGIVVLFHWEYWR